MVCVDTDVGMAATKDAPTDMRAAMQCNAASSSWREGQLQCTCSIRGSSSGWHQQGGAAQPSQRRHAMSRARCVAMHGSGWLHARCAAR